MKILCDKCFNTRAIVSENGYHKACVLNPNAIRACLKDGRHFLMSPLYKNKNNDVCNPELYMPDEIEVYHFDVPNQREED